MKKYVTFLLCLWLAGCTSLPDQITPVTPFQLDRYLGTWYEVARLDHAFERGLSNVSATYRLREGGGITVVNRGFDDATQRWQETEGKAFFVTDSNTAHLKVSFFGPFYGAYGVFYLDEAYQHALVAGNSHDYLWILSRSPQVAEQTRQAMIHLARQQGFDTDQLIWVAHQSER
jgi:apolipoprotein D and lipocalin family protein